MGKFIPGLVKQIHFFPERDDETLEIVQILTTQNFEKYWEEWVEGESRWFGQNED